MLSLSFDRKRRSLFFVKFGAIAAAFLTMSEQEPERDRCM